MKKHWLFATLSALIICVLCFTLFPTEAKAATDGYLTYEIIDCEAFITDCDDTFSGEITIPDTLGGYPVTTIAEFAFAHLTNPISINTGNSVTTISDAAFLGNTGLTSITLGDSVQTIGSLAFEACDNLGSFAVSANNPYFSTVDGVLFSKDATVLFAAPKTISGEYTVPAGVLTVGDYAFDGCMGLTDLIIGDNVITVSTRAFNNCMNLKTVKLGSCVTTIANYAFSNCNRMKNIVIPVSTATISDHAFYRCTSLTDVYYAGTESQWIAVSIGSNNDPLNSVTLHYESDGTEMNDPAYLIYEIVDGEAIIVDCDDSVSGEITIPDTLGGYPVTGIGGWAFNGCQATSITIPNTVTTIGDGAFQGAQLATFFIPEYVSEIGQVAFYGCDNLAGFVVDADNPFYANDGYGVLFNKPLTELIAAPGALQGTYTIPDSVTTVGYAAFFGCEQLTQLNIPAGVTNMDPEIFADCNSLGTITVDPENPSYFADDHSVLYNMEKTAIYYAPKSLSGNYIIPDGVTTLNNAFEYCSDLTGIYFPASLTNIDSQFSGCNLKKVYIPATVTIFNFDLHQFEESQARVLYAGTQLQWDAIYMTHNNTNKHPQYLNLSYNCAPVTWNLSYNIYEGGAYITDCDESATGSITIPDTLGGYPVVGVDPWAFQDCDTITEIHLPDSVNYIGINAFAYCDNLTTVTMSNNVTVIGEGAFAGCTSLTGFDIPDNITTIENSTFYCCGSLTEITIPHGVAVIGESAFNKCGNLTRVEIPTSVSIIEDYAFVECTSLTEITIPHGVTSIGESVFYKCTNLKSISLPNTLTTIGQYAFKECTWLKSIAIPDSVTSIGNNAFEYCSNLRSAVVGSGLTQIPSGLFWANVSMTNITFSNTLVSIPDGAFYFCDNLTDVYYRGTAQQMALIEDNDARTAAATWHCDSCIGTDVHDYEETVTRASLADDGYITRGCTVCGATGETTVIPRVDAFSLPGHILIADGTQKRPVPTVWDREGNALTEGVNYTVTYPANAVEAGDYELRITLTGNYSGEKILHYAIEPALEITQQPTTQKVKAGATAKFTVGTVGFGVDYQWQSSTNGTTWKNCSSSSATKATFSFTSKTSHNGNYYRCVITDHEGNVVCTDAVRLYVLGVTTQPKTAKVKTGSTAKFTVKASGDGLKYQWQSSTNGKTWKNCSSSSAKKATFSFTSKTSHSSNYYRCKITDSEGNVVYTNAVRLYVLGVTKQPATQKVAAGKTVKFTVTATGAGKTYQWQVSTDGKTWKNCSSSSAKKSTFTFTGKTSHSGNYYRCRIKDNGGNTVYTDAVKLYVLGITEQPVKKTVTKGKTAKFTVEATGASKVYQWQVSTDGGKTWKNCSSSSAKKAAFSFTAKTSHNGNYYRCRVKDSGGNTVYTNKVKLTVKK